MIFAYAERPHVRKHAPEGYADAASFKPWLRDEFQFRCVYCLERERWSPSGHATFGVDHVRPKSIPENLPIVLDYRNLVYACNRCNSAKSDQSLLDPCDASFAEHIRVIEDGTIQGLTQKGSHLINLLGLDKSKPCAVRRRALRILRLIRDNPMDVAVRALYLDYFGYPDDLPNLATLRPPTNSRPEGIDESYWRKRDEKRLAETYY